MLHKALIPYRSSICAAPQFAAIVVACFVLTTLVFIVYDFMVTLRNKRVMDTAEKTTAIVSSLFPSNVRDRIMEEAGQATDEKKKENRKNAFLANNARQPDITGYNPSEAIYGSKPIADLVSAGNMLDRSDQRAPPRLHH